MENEISQTLEEIKRQSEMRRLEIIQEQVLSLCKFIESKCIKLNNVYMYFVLF